ncbi:MAG TPA: protein kinase [Actinoplanes sp.]
MDTGQTIAGRYRLLERLGAGGMSVVWRASDTVLGREVALKVLSADVAADPALLRQLYAEARAAAGLRHANVVEVYDYGEASGLPYVVMELVAGRPVNALLSAGPLPWRVAVLIAAQVAAALAAAHERGVVHRDVKPANVMVTTNGVKLVDFGISAATGERDSEPSFILGTPAYLAPERLAGGLVRPATDVYALGLLLYMMIAGRLPWQASTTTQMLRAHWYQEPAPLPPVPEMPPEVAELCRRCLAKAPEDRPPAEAAAHTLAGIAGIPLASPLSALFGDAAAGAPGPARPGFAPLADGRAGHGRAGSVSPVDGRAGHGLVGSVSPADGRVGQGLAGFVSPADRHTDFVPPPGDGQAGSASSGDGRAGSALSGDGRAGSASSSDGRAGFVPSAGEPGPDGASHEGGAASVSAVPPVDHTKKLPARPAPTHPASTRPRSPGLNFRRPATRRTAIAAAAALLVAGPAFAWWLTRPDSHTAAAAAGPRPTATVTPIRCTVRYAVQDVSDGRTSTALTLVNDGTTAVGRWRLAFRLPTGQQLIHGSNATWHQSGTDVRADGPALTPGHPLTTTFETSYEDATTLPDSFTLNGVACRSDLSLRGHTTPPTTSTRAITQGGPPAPATPAADKPGKGPDPDDHGKGKGKGKD